MTTFSLANKGLKLDTKESITEHIGPLSSATDIKHIDLSGNTLGVGACEALAPLLSKQSKLEYADLHDIFTGRLVEEIPPALDHLLTALLQCPNLHTVDLSDNAFGLKTKDPLVDFLSKHTPLKNLILNNNGMGPIAGTSIAEALTHLAAKKAKVRKEGKDVPELESVVCGRNRLENGSMQAWAQAYQAHKSGMKSVKMTQNGIRPEGISLLISDGLSTCERLEVFDLQDNTFTIKGATALAKAVPKWPNLKELGVGDDLLGARGSIKVFEALGKGGNKEVEILRLEYNDITPPGVKALLQATKDGLPALRRVELNGNKFEEDDASVEDLAALLSDRKEEKGKDDDPESHWGVGDLDELEGEDEDDDEEEEEGAEPDEEDEEADEKREKTLKEADEAEEANVSQKKDADVDELADILGKTKV
ncbi:Ran GAP Rna1 [Neophaeococcomyces mojaviensis]|uniref:Ran GAP Rna1 n=1 Tax=Neophaeococcomyces mojaviensis TaxID=3383035 RepID=A0ACC3A9I7_9EURO|nr:Ran GAP Rna1 [Knufia sp. JES_112]